MLNVYNYYVSDFLSHTPACSAHKRNELRDIYKSIVKLSVTEPLYKIDLSEQKQSSALSIKESALKLKDLLLSLKDSSKTAFAGFRSDDSSKVSASFLGQTSFSADKAFSSYQVTVASMASGQSNVGAVLPSEEACLSEGSYSFLASFGEENYSFRFLVAKDSPAFELQSKLSEFINKSGLPLHSEVSFHKEKKLCRMTISATNTGLTGKSHFTLSDEELPSGAKKGIISAFGLSSATYREMNASGTINGEPFSSETNEVSYQGSVLFSLHGETDAPVTLTPVPETGTSAENFSDFLSGFNQLVQTGKKSAILNKSSEHLLNSLSHVVASNYAELINSGIVCSSDGYLMADKEPMENISDSNISRQLFSKNSQFLKSLDNRLSSIILNPMKYVDKKLVTYPNPEAAKKRGAGTYVTSVYSGMLFNNYC